MAPEGTHATHIASRSSKFSDFLRFTICSKIVIKDSSALSTLSQPCAAAALTVHWVVPDFRKQKLRYPDAFHRDRKRELPPMVPMDINTPRTRLFGFEAASNEEKEELG
jgi:hypothetical protein